MVLLEEYTQKLTTHYEDRPHRDIINGEMMYEKSSVSLMPSDFRLHMSREYLKLILDRRSRE
jgi:hypothetical protein